MVIFIARIAFITSQQKKKLESHEKVRENKDFCNIIMPSQYTKILDMQIMQILNVQYKILMDIKTILKIRLRKSK